MRVGLIACCAQKLDEPAPARELYQSDLFRKAMTWIEKRVDEWGILSAKHGLVLPDQILEPYDLSLDELAAEERRKWEARVRKQLLEQWGDQVIYMVLAGCHYKRALYDFPMVEDPVAHWTELRRARGMRRPAIGIGVLKKLLKEDHHYG